jgi:chemotaxis protein methyltransferase CheR
MNTNSRAPFPVSGEVLTDSAFHKLGAFIQEESGIKMPDVKKTMLQSRLQKRLRALGMSSMKDYCEWVLGPDGGGEIVHMIDVVTTNKTDFFREPGHFEFLTRNALPQFPDCGRMGRPFRVWSAGCSSGEEPYTLAMVLSEYALSCPGFTFDITATDLSTAVLDKAKTAIYVKDLIEPVPFELRRKYLMHNKNPEKPLYRIVPELRDRVRFGQLNFMHKSWKFKNPFDVIFCRNVIIYFDRETQQTLLNRFVDNLASGGFLFLGHSETLNGLDLPLTIAAPTVYRKAGVA